MVAIVDYRKILPYLDNASACDAALTQDLGFIVFLQKDNTLFSVELQHYFAKHQNDIWAPRTTGPGPTRSSDRSMSVDEDLPMYESLKQSRSLPASRNAQHRVRWLHKLGLVEKQTNRPPVPKPPWYQTAGEDVVKLNFFLSVDVKKRCRLIWNKFYLFYLFTIYIVS